MNKKVKNGIKLLEAVNPVNKKEVYEFLEKANDENLPCEETFSWIRKNVDFEVKDYLEHFDSKYAFLWARYVGNKEIMIDRITDSLYAYWWAKLIGDKEIMIDRVVSPCWKQRIEGLL